MFVYTCIAPHAKEKLIKKSQKRQSREGTWAQMGPESVTVNPLSLVGAAGLASYEMRESVAA